MAFPSTHVSCLSSSLPTQILSLLKLLVSSYLQYCDKLRMEKRASHSSSRPALESYSQPWLVPTLEIAQTVLASRVRSVLEKEGKSGLCRLSELKPRPGFEDWNWFWWLVFHYSYSRLSFSFQPLWASDLWELRLCHSAKHFLFNLRENRWTEEAEEEEDRGPGWALSIQILY